MRLKPLHDKLLIKRLEAEERTAGGLVLPDTAREKPREGRIISVGDGPLTDEGKRAPFEVKANDRVIFNSYAGTEVTLEGEKYLIMTQEDVLAVVE